MSQPFGTSSDSKIEGFQWLPDVDANRSPQYQYCQLVIKIAILRGKGGFIFLGDRPN